MRIRIDMGKGVMLRATLAGKDTEAVANAFRAALSPAPQGTRTESWRLLYLGDDPALLLPSGPWDVADIVQ